MTHAGVCHSVLLRGRPVRRRKLEDMVDIAITECERFFPGSSSCCGRKAPNDAWRGDAGVCREA